MAFFRRDGDHLVPTVFTRGPWHPEQQHGGPPSALLTGVLQAAAPEGMHLTRLTVEFLRAVPLAPLTVSLGPWEGGRTLRRGVAELLHEGRSVLRARGQFVRSLAVGAVPAPADVPGPKTVERFLFPFFPWDEGYHQAIDTRVVDGAWPDTPLTCWARPLQDIVEGEASTPEQRVVVIADAQSGLGPPTDLDRFTFVNPDLTVVFARPPEGEWLGFTVDGFVGDTGSGLAEAALFDARGRFGRSIQTVVVAPRPT